MTRFELLSTDSKLGFGQNQWEGVEVVSKFGRNISVDIASPAEDLFGGSGGYEGQPLGFTPETVDVYSSDVNDTDAGSGAEAVRIFGLKTPESETYESEDITLDGTTHATSTGTWWRVNRIFVTRGDVNVGTLTVGATTAGHVFGIIPPGIAQSMIAAFTVPANRTLLIERLNAEITRANGSNGSATVTLRVRTPGGVFRAAESWELSTSSSVHVAYKYGESFEAGSDLKFRVEDVSDNATICTASFEGLLAEVNAS